MKQFYATLLFLCPFFSSHAQQLLKDVYSSNGSTLDFAYSVTIGNNVYFTASSNSYGENNLYKTDGTSSGTVQLNSTASGTTFIRSNSLTALNEKIIFKAISPTTGIAGLYASDGTTAGTVKIIDLISYTNSFSALGIMNNVLYFSDMQSSVGAEVWRTDGTTAGTYLLKDINPGTASSSPSRFTVLDNVAYFQAFTNSMGYELWKTDGTETGTVLVKNIQSGTSSSYPGNFIALDNTLYFIADNGINGTELWKTDGSEGGTVIVKDINVGTSSSYPGNFKILGNKLYFTVFDNGIYKLWFSDGTINGTQIFNNQLYYTSHFTVLNNQLIFTASEGINGVELWKSDGTIAGTGLLKDINLNSTNYDNFTFSQDPRFTIVGNQVFFWANNGINGRELWKTDGTGAGTSLVKDLDNLPSNSLVSTSDFFKIGNKLTFKVAPSVNETDEMWLSDGTTVGTVKVSSLNPALNIELARVLLTGSEENIFFTAYNSTIGYELYRTDGTIANTVLVKDITIGNEKSSMDFGDRFIPFNNLVFFTANDGKAGKELWVTDGTAANTFLYKDFSQVNGEGSFYNLGATYGSTVFNNFTIYNNELYWVTNGRFLWKTNGLSAPVNVLNTYNTNSDKAGFGQLNNELYFLGGAILYKGDGNKFSAIKNNISFYSWGTGIASDLANRMTPYNGYLYFAASATVNNESKGYELWRTDGTAAGTTMVKDIYSGSSSSIPFSFVVYNNKLYFIATNGINGNELWQSDGTEAGTTMVTDLFPGSGNGLPYYPSSDDIHGVLVVHNEKLYFRGTNGSTGFELWQSDGTATGSILVKDISIGSGSSDPNSLISYKDQLYFNSGGVYMTDGTANGTQLLKINANPYGRLVKGDSSLYLSLSEYSLVPEYLQKGYEVYRSDGTKAGTVRLTDIQPGNSSSFPELMSFYNGKLYFSAQSSDIGREPWILRSDCPDEYSFSNPGETTPSGSTYRFKAAKRIEAFNTLQTNSNVVYQAANSLELKPGFSASGGAMFKAQIGGCDTDINALSSRTAVKDLKKLLTTPAVPRGEDKKSMQLPTVEEFLRQQGGEEIRHLIERQRMAKASYESLSMAERVKQNPVSEPGIAVEYVRTEGDEQVFRIRVHLGGQLREVELRKR